MPEASFDAFLSYRRSDGAALARWLRRELESFHLPRSLRQDYPRKLKIYQDTAYERGTSDFYEHSIRPALLASRHLVVIATPDAVRRREGVEDWIQREVDDFSRGPNAGNVIAVRGGGEFDGPLPADLAVRFPQIEIVDLRGASRLAFLNPTRGARLADEKLKLLAPLLDIAPADMPRLRQEEEKRQQARLGMAAGVTLATLLFVSGTSIFAFQSRNRATKALESSLFSTSRMVGALSRLGQQGQTGELRAQLLAEGCDLIDKLRTESDRDTSIGELVTCRIERAGSHERLKEFDSARRQLDEALALATDRHQRTSLAEAGRGMIEARQELAAFLQRREDLDGSRTAYKQLLADATSLTQQHEHRAEFPEAEAQAHAQIGDLDAAVKDSTAAAEAYDRAADAVERAARDAMEQQQPRLLLWRARLKTLSGELRLELGDSVGALIRFKSALEATGRIDGKSALRPAADQQIALAQSQIFQIESRNRNLEAAGAAREQALAAVARVLAADKADEGLKSQAKVLQDWIGSQPALSADTR